METVKDVVLVNFVKFLMENLKNLDADNMKLHVDFLEDQGNWVTAKGHFILKSFETKSGNLETFTYNN